MVSYFGNLICLYFLINCFNDLYFLINCFYNASLSAAKYSFNLANTHLLVTGFENLDSKLKIYSNTPISKAGFVTNISKNKQRVFGLNIWLVCSLELRETDADADVTREFHSLEHTNFYFLLIFAHIFLLIC